MSGKSQEVPSDVPCKSAVVTPPKAPKPVDKSCHRGTDHPCMYIIIYTYIITYVLYIYCSTQYYIVLSYCIYAIIHLFTDMTSPFVLNVDHYTVPNPGPVQPAAPCTSLGRMPVLHSQGLADVCVLKYAWLSGHPSQSTNSKKMFSLWPV